MERDPLLSFGVPHRVGHIAAQGAVLQARTLAESGALGNGPMWRAFNERVTGSRIDKKTTPSYVIER
jgi:hypothetical protein